MKNPTKMPISGTSGIAGPRAPSKEGREAG